ncbi:MAG: SMI1/KNR4 family protein [Saprospiraceae bacterium]
MRKLQLLKTKLEKLRTLDKKFEAFGVKSHYYRFNKKLSESKVLEFESKYQIRLPKDYRNFLLELGDGGVGPYYGIMKLAEVIPSYHQNDIAILKDKFPFTDDWNWSPKIFEMFDFLRGGGFNNLQEYFFQKSLMTSEWEVPKEEWEAIQLLSGKVNLGNEVAEFFGNIYWESYFSREIDKGSIELCEYGCALRFRLIISGPEKGKIWFDERADRNGMSPVRNNKGEKLDFITWYMNWLDETIKQFEQ